MLAAGFLPDVISSDVHALCVNGPAYDLLVTMSKMLVLGMPLQDVVAAATSAPAEAVDRPELGSLAVGSAADATVLEWVEGDFLYRDVLQNERRGNQLQLRGMVRGGRWLTQ